MKRPPIIELSAERPGRSASADTARLQRCFELDADRPRRIDHYIDYFGGGGAGAMRRHVASAGSIGDDAC